MQPVVSLLGATAQECGRPLRQVARFADHPARKVVVDGDKSGFSGGQHQTNGMSSACPVS